MTKHMTATEARKNFFALLTIAEQPGMPVTIVREGHPPIVVMSLEEFEGWQETLEIIADPSMDRDIRRALKELKAGTLSKKAVSLDTLKKKLRC